MTTPSNPTPAARPPFSPTIIPGLRSPYEQVGGVVHFPRMVDKIRLHQAGRLPPAWVASLGAARGFDGTCCALLGIDYAMFKARVLAAPEATDDALLEWAFQHGRRPSTEEIQAWSEALSKRGWRDAFAERVRIRLEEVGLPEGAAKTMFDFIELDEGRPTRAKLE